jgi:hypothetical protein
MLSNKASVEGAMKYLFLKLKHNRTIGQYIEKEKSRKERQRIQEYYDKKENWEKQIPV